MLTIDDFLRSGSYDPKYLILGDSIRKYWRDFNDLEDANSSAIEGVLQGLGPKQILSRISRELKNEVACCELDENKIDFGPEIIRIQDGEEDVKWKIRLTLGEIDSSELSKKLGKTRRRAQQKIKKIREETECWLRGEPGQQLIDLFEIKDVLGDL